MVWIVALCSVLLWSTSERTPHSCPSIQHARVASACAWRCWLHTSANDDLFLILRTCRMYHTTITIILYVHSTYLMYYVLHCFTLFQHARCLSSTCAWCLLVSQAWWYAIFLVWWCWLRIIWTLNVLRLLWCSNYDTAYRICINVDVFLAGFRTGWFARTASFLPSWRASCDTLTARECLNPITRLRCMNLWMS